MENQIAVEVKKLLGIKEICSQEFIALLNHVTDPVIVEKHNLRRLAEKVLGGKCSDKEKSIYAQILSTLVQDFHNLKRDEVFPVGVATTAKVMFYLYLLNKDVADDKTIEQHFPALSVLVCGKKYCQLGHLSPNEAMNELEWLIKYTMIRNNACKADKVALNQYYTFEDFNLGSLDRYFLVDALEKYLNIAELLKTMPDDDDTIREYSEKAYADLFC